MEILGCMPLFYSSLLLFYLNLLTCFSFDKDTSPLFLVCLSAVSLKHLKLGMVSAAFKIRTNANLQQMATACLLNQT